MSRSQNEDLIQHLLLKKRKQLRTSSLPADTKPSVQRAVHYLHVHLFDPKLTVGRVLDECNIVSKTYSQRFRMRMGHTPHNYIQRHRIDAACTLFAHGIDNVFRVGLSVGYDRYRTFLRNFKEIVGRTPSEFIREHASPERKTAS